ncbi:hypothetical protein M9Y10_010552 [Tritrichomonas musculus]|uniref:Sel1 repeat family protein n=1 Tax=Tritrichomonas musculus TaxID=1915356 RepID=A0ABR2IL71_9EUKA
MKKNITNAIRYYKESSSFNNEYSKNNLGIIYKNGFGEEIRPNLGLAIEYFKEAINQKNDIIAMYNLAHIYFFNDHIKEEFDPIELLIRSSNKGFEESLTLLCIVLFNKYGYDIEKIDQQLNEIEIDKKNEINTLICEFIDNKSSYEALYQQYRNIDFLYDILSNPIKSNEIFKKEEKTDVNRTAKEITSIFYEGFGFDI